MGYTRYWERTEKPITKDFVIKVCNIIADCNEKGIAIRNGDGEGNPVVTLDMIDINGDGAKNLWHENLLITNNNTGFNFCKTQYKPYDYAVRKILAAATEEGIVTNVSDDGEYEEILSDKDFIRRYSRDRDVYR